MPRGGRRSGQPGTAYSNRTDLNRPEPIRTAKGQPYGTATAQADAQRAMPIAASPSATPALPAGRPPVAPPGSLPYLDPTQRPNEPVTAGLPFGPGAGPEALTPHYPSLGQILSSGANGSATSALAQQMALAANSLGL